MRFSTRAAPQPPYSPKGPPVAFARSDMFKNAVVRDGLMMTGKFAGLGVGSLARLSRRWLNRKSSCRSGGKLAPLFWKHLKHLVYRERLKRGAFASFRRRSFPSAKGDGNVGKVTRGCQFDDLPQKGCTFDFHRSRDSDRRAHTLRFQIRHSLNPTVPFRQSSLKA